MLTGPWSKDDKERYVANRFCQSLGDGWEIDFSHREKPDFLLARRTERVGLELVECRQVGPQDEAVGYDKEFRKEIHEQWLDDKDVQHWSVYIEYRKSRKKNIEKYHVPPPKQRKSCIDELKRLAKSLVPRPNGHIEVCFNEDLKKTPLKHWFTPSDLVLVQQYPTLHKHFISFRFEYQPGLFFGWPRSNLDTGFLGVDDGELRRVIQQHLEQLPEYRRRVSVPVWILVYNTGQAATRRIVDDPNLIQQIQNLVRQEHVSAEDQFDKVWWGSNMMMKGAEPPLVRQIL